MEDDELVQLSEAAWELLKADYEKYHQPERPFDLQEDEEPFSEIEYVEVKHPPDLEFICNEKTDWIPTKVKDN